jgi:hypothetical protein
MLNFSRIKIHGDVARVGDVRTIFGHVEFQGEELLDESISFHVVAFPNYYASNLPEQDPQALLYVLVPNKIIHAVWSGRCDIYGIDNVRYGCATKGGRVITGAVAISKGVKTLYFCLSPNGVEIDGTGNLGI